MILDQMRASDPGAGTLTAGAVEAVSSDADGPARFAATVEEVLDRVGGPLWAEYTRG
ncbi:hypothetical protein [Kitasatospora acidiphila]|uniref:hypothetical protein n=1 Tax=Kitasatospora acidiphila TaxID=2567942 RepID=UPI0015EFEB75|nr:hypothetical protein [Kitasatospora acidiphila]